MAVEYWILLFKVVFVFGAVAQPLASLCVWVERKGSALIQDRVGANRAGAAIMYPNSIIPLGTLLSSAPRLIQILAKIVGILIYPLLWVAKWLGILGVINTLVCDAAKALFKEDFVPEGTSNFMHSLAPFMAAFPIMLAFAVIPIAPSFTVAGYQITPMIADLNVGVLFIFAMASLAVYGVTIAAWVGNNKFSLFGGIRAAAQMISYELALGISLVTTIVLYDTMSLYQMVELQSKPLFGFIPAWGVFLQFPAFLIFFIAGMAETKRAPFDLPESESELVAGYFTEYSGMKFLLFWLGEFTEIALLAALMTLMFFGGWHLPGLDGGLNWLASQVGSGWLADGLAEQGWIRALAGHAVFMGKVTFFCVLQIVIRWTLPRFRYDQLMNLGWKMLLPISLVNLMITAGFVLAF